MVRKVLLVLFGLLIVGRFGGCSQSGLAQSFTHLNLDANRISWERLSYQGKNRWSEAINLGPKINTGAAERFPSVTPDGKYLFFLRVSDGSDFYWVSAKIIETLKPEDLK